MIEFCPFCKPTPMGFSTITCTIHSNLQSKNTQRCKECGDLVEHCGELNNISQCSECSMICQLCGVSVNREPVVDGICLKCK